MSEKPHVFLPSLAQEFGVYEAIAIHAFQWWIGEHRDKGEFLFEGRHWCYYAVADLAKQWPYFTPDQVRRIMESLLKQGVLLRGNWWKEAGWKIASRVTWFAFSDEERFLGSRCGENPKSNWRKPQMDLAKSPNGSGEKPKSTKEVFHDSFSNNIACMHGAEPQNSAKAPAAAAAAAAAADMPQAAPEPAAARPDASAGIPAQISALSPQAERLRAVFHYEDDDAQRLGALCKPEHVEPWIARAGQLAAKDGVPIHMKAGFVLKMIDQGKSPPPVPDSGSKGGEARTATPPDERQQRIEAYHRGRVEETRKLRQDLRQPIDPEQKARTDAELAQFNAEMARRMGRRSAP
jgi:hypothetical protein